MASKLSGGLAWPKSMTGVPASNAIQTNLRVPDMLLFSPLMSISCYRKSSKYVTLSAFVQRPALPAFAKVRSSVSKTCAPLKNTLN